MVCKANEIYDDCKIRCDQLCHYYDGFLEAQGFCKVRIAAYSLQMTSFVLTMFATYGQRILCVSVLIAR